MPKLQELRAQYPELEGLDDESAVDALHQAFYADMDRETVASALGVKKAAPPPEPSSTARRVFGDTGVSLLKGAIAVPEAAVGLADLVTGGRAGKMAEQAGFRPAEARQILDEWYSPEQRAANQEVRDADGIAATLGAAVRNPSVIAQGAVESLPLMAGGAVPARVLMRAAPRVGAAAAGAVGEGIVGAGSAAEQVRQQTADGLLTPEQAQLAAGSGAATSVIGYMGAKIARSLGIADVDTMLAGAARDGATRKGVVRRTLEGFASEGLLEELPQSVQEQVAQNLALDRPLDEGVDEAAVLGTLTGGLMGGGAQFLPQSKPAGPLTRAVQRGAAEAPPMVPPIPEQPEGEAPAAPAAAVLPASVPVGTTAVDPFTGAPPAEQPSVKPLGRVDPDVALGRMEAMVKREEKAARSAAIAADRAMAKDAEQRGKKAEAGEVPADALELDPPLDTDILNPEGEPFKNRGAAQRALKKNPGTGIAVVQGGWVLRPIQSQQQSEEAPAAPAEQPIDTPAPAAEQPQAEEPEWAAFPTDTGTKGVARADMPQIKAGDRSALVQFLRARDVDYTEETVQPADLKPTQAEYSPAKVRQAAEYSDTDRAILVSQDGHVVDGHHQWLAKATNGEPVRVLRLDAPIDALLPLVREFPSAGAADGATEAAAAAAEDADAALERRGFKDTGPGPDEWVLPVSNLGDVIAKVVSKPGEPLRAEISADYMGKRLDTRTAEGDAAIDEAIERARDGIQAGREKLAQRVMAEDGIEQPKAAVALPAPTAGARWDAMGADDREGALVAAGWKPGSPGTTELKAKAWDTIKQRQRVRIEAAMAGKTDDTQQQERPEPEAQAAAVEAPAAEGSDAAGQERAAEPADAGPAPVQAAGVEPPLSKEERAKLLGAFDAAPLGSTIRFRGRTFEKRTASVWGLSGTTTGPQRSSSFFVDSGVRGGLRHPKEGAPVPARSSEQPTEQRDAAGLSISGTEIGAADMPTVELRRAAADWASQNLVGHEFTNADTGAAIAVTKQGVKHALSNANAAEVRLLAGLGRMLEAATLESSEPDNRGRPDIKAVHRYRVEVSLAGEALTVGIVVREMADGHRFYDHFILPGQKEQSPAGISEATTDERTLGDQPAAGDGAIVAPDRTENGPAVEPQAPRADTPKQETPDDPAPSTDAPAVDPAVAAGQRSLIDGDEPVRGAAAPRARAGRADDRGVRGTRGRAQAADDGERKLGDGRGDEDVPDRPADAVGRGGDRVPAGADFRPAAGGLTREGSWFDTARRNIDLIDLALTIEKEGRPATPEEQARLSKYVGFGASEIRNNLFPVPPAWKKAEDPKRLIWPSEVREARWKALAERMEALPEAWQRSVLQSTQYAHYTSEGIIRSVWSGLQRLGFTGGKVLEPGMGIGSFAMLMPETVRKTSKYTGIEFDAPTALIARLLSPEQNMLHDDFIKRKLPRDFFDVAVGNPPFSQTQILGDPDYEKHRFMLHDFFFAKSMDRVRPGGVLVFVTSKGTMDKQSDKARRYLAERADLLGAIRLPSTAFEANAGTSVVTDVLFLRKRLPGEAPAGSAWQSVATVETTDGPVVVNEYFAANPDMVLGQNRISGNRDDEGRRISANGYGGDAYTVVSYDKTPAELDAKFAAAVERLPANAYSPLRQSSESVKRETAKVDFDPAVRREGVVYVDKDGALMRVEGGVGKELAAAVKLSEKDQAWFKGYVGLREQVQLARAAQVQDGDWKAALDALNEAYDAFRKAHGPINDFRTQVRTSTDEEGNPVETAIRIFKNRRLFREDYDAAIVTQLETINEAGEIVKAPFLKGRTIGKPLVREVKTIGDALAVSLDETGRLDLDDVARRIGLSRAEAIEALGPQVYETPQGQWQLADEYLSGDVVTKLEEAEQAARITPRLARNVDGLKRVQPDKLGPSQISVKLGASWVPVEHVNDFAKEIEAGSVTFDPKTETWQVNGANTRSGRKAGAEYGTAARSPSELLEAVLNSQAIKVTRTTIEKKTETDPEATAAANEAAKKIKDKFKSWVWTDSDRASELVEIYNKRFNNIAPRAFDGSHLTLPGVSLRFSLHPHQKRAIWRQIQTGDVYLAHAVGAGKTIEMIAGGMEQKRLGLIRKPIYAVPNHMLEQFANEFMELYPLANIMVADDENFSAERRKAFVAAATLNAPDAIIITHSAFERIGVKEESVAPIRDDILLDLQVELDDVDKGDRVRRSQLQQQIEAVEQRFESILGAGRKDSTIKFEDIGADYIYVDEAHAFRKLDFSTNQRIKGIDPNGSRRALDMYVKTRYLGRQRPGRAMTFASGTAVTNTMGELYTIMRFFAPEELSRSGISTFDAWARQFGEVVPALEANAAGRYEVVERFAKFDNVPELMSRVRQFMDVLTSENLGALVKRPDIEGGKPDLITVEPTPDLKSYMKTELLPRLEKSRRWKPSKDQPFNPDPVIAITSDGRFAALDPRFFGASIDEERTPTKLTRMADEIVAFYKATAGNVYTDASGKPEAIKGATQIVFYNLGFGAQSQANRGFNARAALTKRLTAGGVKREHILWFDDANTDAKKEAMFKAMRSGEARILIGSAKKMGTGVNVQRRLGALHYFDPPWYPSDVEQPHGRIIRQGNQNPVARIKWYATKGTYDATMWQMVGRKQRFIDQAFSGDKSVRSMEDMSEASMFEQAAAVASGDPRAMQLAGLRQDVERLERLQAAHANEQINVRSALRSAEWNVDIHTKQIEKYGAAFKAIGATYYRFSEGAVGGRSFDKPGEFGEALKQAFNKGAADAVLDPKTETRQLATMAGGVSLRMDQQYEKEGKPDGTHELVLTAGGLDMTVVVGSGMGSDVSAVGLSQKLVNTVNSIERELEEHKRRLADNQTDVTRLRKKLGAPFEHQQELAEKYGDLKRLEEELRAEGEAEAKAAATEIKIDAQGESLSIAADAAELDRLGKAFSGLSAVDGSMLRAETVGYGRASDAHRSLAATMQRRLARSFPGTVFDAVAPGQGPRGDSLRAATLVARRLFGHEVVPVDFKSAPLFNGAMSDAIPNAVFIRADSDKPHMAVLGHELLHQMRAQQPGLYEHLVKRLDKLMIGEQRYVQAKQAKYGGATEGVHVDWMEELRADIVGDFFVDREFWQDMAKDQPSLFRRVVNAILRFLDGVIELFSREQPFETAEFLTDVRAARAAVADAMRQFSGAEVGAMTGQSEGISLSIADAWQTATTKKGLTDLYNDLTKSQEGFGWWHKTIGTQYQKAKRNADFGKVYQGAQDYLHDTSAFANDAAGQAPTLLPQLKGWRDVLRPIALKEKDRAAVAEAVFKGTLDQVVYDEDQLAAMGLDERQRKLYREFRASVDRSLDILVAGDVARALGKDLPPAIKQMVSDGDTGRFKGLVKTFLAQKAGEAQTATVELRKRHRKEKAALARAHANEIRTTKTASTIARDARHEEEQAALAARHQGELDGAEATERMWKGLQSRVVDKYMRVDELKEQGYAPLMRFGRYSVYVTREGGDGEREQVYFGLYETQREANAAARTFQETEEGATVQQGVLSEEGYKLFSGMSPETMAVFADLAGMERNEQFEAYLKLAVANRSALKRLIKRKGVAGFSEDVSRVLASFVTSNARAASGSLHLGDMADAIGDMQERRVAGDVIDEAIKLREYVQNPTEEAQAVRGLLFAQYLGGSVASAMVNMTQPFTMTFPFLSQFGGPAKAGARLAAGIKQAVGRVAPGSELGRALAKAEKEGVVSPQEIHQLQAEAARNVGNRPWVRKGVFLWGSLFSLAEQFNRRATFIAAFNTAKAEGMADPFAFAVDAVDQTQGVYNRGNKPNWARGALGGTLFTFKQFSIGYLEFLSRLPTREKALALAVLMLAAGAQGLPFMDDLDDLIDTLAQQAGYDFNSKQAKVRFLTGVLGRGGADFMLHGFSAIPGFPLDVSARMSVGNLLPGTGLLLKSETDKGRGMQELLGPAGSLGADALKFAETRDPLVAVPIAIRNLAKGLDMLLTGQYSDTKGRKVMDTTTTDAVAKMVGFQPADVARESRTSSENRQQISLAKVVESEIVSAWAAALVDGKPEGVREARERLVEWNRKNPQSRIAISQPQIARKAREMRMTRQQRLEKSAPKELRPTLQ